MNATTQATLFSSVKPDWETPQAFFDRLNKEFHFRNDMAASHENAKCFFHYSEADDSLSRDWPRLDPLGACWLNPPYGRTIGHWVAKAHAEAIAGSLVVCLLPSRTCTKWWHEHVMKADEIRFVRGRLSFGDGGAPAPFPSVVVVFRPPVKPALESPAISSYPAK